MNFVRFLPIVSTPTYILPENLRRLTIEDTSYSTFLPSLRPRLCVFVPYLEPSTVYDVGFAC